ncbi:MAG: GGDEF domain-containing protein [Syntrophobacteraceae bacterium]
MAVTSSRQRPIQSLERLSEVVIDTLKELSSNRQPLTTSHLCQAMSGRTEIMNLLAHAGNGEFAQSPETEHQALVEVESLKQMVQTARADKKQSDLDAINLREQSSRVHSFCKRSLLALTGLLYTPNNSLFFEAIDRFKKLVLDEADLDVLEASLNELKNAVLNKDTFPKESEDGSGGLFGKWFKRKDASGGVDLSREVYLKQLQDAYLSILAEFRQDLGRDYLDHFTKVEQDVRESESLEQLLARNSDLLSLIQSYIRLNNQERGEVTDLISEIGHSLIQIEAQFLCSFDRTAEGHESNSAFGKMLDGQMEEINHSAQFSKTLAEFKELVASRLSAIRLALEEKQKADRHHEEASRKEKENLQVHLHSLKKEIDQAHKRSKALEKESLMDALTGIPNRRAYERRVREELQRFVRYQQNFSLILFDLDHFKLVNDNYGHWAGDKCLKELIKRIKPTLRESDYLARYGGEEFVIVLPGTDQESAYKVGERLVRIIEKTRFLYQGQEIPLTISVGVTQVCGSDQNHEAIFNRVDKAMYEAKQSGRNRAVLV